MMRRASVFRLGAAALAAALVLAVPAASVAHEHAEWAESQCRICETSLGGVAIVRPGPALSAPVGSAVIRLERICRTPLPPAAAPGAPRAPPA